MLRVKNADEVARQKGHGGEDDTTNEFEMNGGEVFMLMKALA